ncbi:MAG: protein kinase [Lentisphaerota bacterium]
MTSKDSIDILADRVDRIACRKCGKHLDCGDQPSFSMVECPDCHTQQTVPALLGQFLLLEHLGAGGMGAVYQALDQALGRYVAIKVMKKSLGDDIHFVENFLREARAAAAINHRNVVQIYSCGQEKGQPYIVMELVSGGRFDEMIADGNPLDEVRALEIGIDIAEGLKAANDIGLIHSDIKPANILFDKEGAAKVADFGLARFINWKDDAPGEIWGTPYYIAPEKARGQKVDHRSDIYSLGATLYHALGAKPPFDGQTATDVVLARLKNPAIGLRVIRPSLQPETADVISRTLESDPFMRYPTYSSLLADLREALRIAKQEQRMLQKKVKKTLPIPLLISVAVIVISMGILFAGMKWMADKRRANEEAVAELIQAKLAPAPTEQAPTQAVDAVQQAIKLKLTIQPFNTAWDKSLAAAMNQMPANRPMATEQIIQKFIDRCPEGGTARAWLYLIQTVACWMDNRPKDATFYLNAIKSMPLISMPDGQKNPLVMPKMLVSYLLEETDEGPLYLETGQWEPWCADLADFFVGLNNFRKGNLDRASKMFSSYLAKTADAPQWPYSFKPIVQEWVTKIDQWKLQDDQVQKLIAGGQAAKAREMLIKTRVSSIPLLQAVIDNAVSRARDAEDVESGKRELAERRIRNQKIQADLDKLDEVRTANIPLIATKDYRKASAAISKVIPELQTAEGQQAYQLLRENIDRQDALKRFLITRISATPFRQPPGSELGGDATAADLNGIRIALGQHGEMVRPWDQISIKLFVQLATTYLDDPSIPASERADKYVSLAVFCYENRGFKPAATYADQAVKLDGGVKTKVRQLMPDLLPD